MRSSPRCIDLYHRPVFNIGVKERHREKFFGGAKVQRENERKGKVHRENERDENIHRERMRGTKRYTERMRGTKTYTERE